MSESPNLPQTADRNHERHLRSVAVDGSLMRQGLADSGNGLQPFGERHLTEIALLQG
jgi:hypothetical protein